MLSVSRRLSSLLLIAAVVLAASFANVARSRAANPVEITFYYPTAVGGPISKVMDNFATDFNAANPDIKVTPVYAGGYPDVYKKIQTEISGGQKSADVAIMLTTDVYSLIDNDYIVSFDDMIKAMPD